MYVTYSSLKFCCVLGFNCVIIIGVGDTKGLYQPTWLALHEVCKDLLHKTWHKSTANKVDQLAIKTKVDKHVNREKKHFHKLNTMGLELPSGSSAQKVMNLSTTCILTVNPWIKAPPSKEHPTCWPKFQIGKHHSPLSPFHYVFEHVKWTCYVNVLNMFSTNGATI